MNIYEMVERQPIRSKSYIGRANIDSIVHKMFKGYTMTEIAKQLNVSHSLISSRLKEYGLDYKVLRKLIKKKYNT